MFDLNADPGVGNLNVRAYLASIVGPRRVVHGQRAVRRVPLVGSIELYRNPDGKQAAYYEVWLPQASLAGLPGGGALLAFSSSSGGGESSYQILLTATQRFSGILIPTDGIYALAIADALGAPLVLPVSVVISTVVF